jgi:hypothetical protein
MNDLSNEYNIVMSEIKNLTLAYNPNDFYYYSAASLLDADFDSVKIDSHSTFNTSCDSIINATIINQIDNKKVDCRNLTVFNNSNNNILASCYNRELCLNRKNAMKISELQTNHDGADTRNIDINVDYNRELLKSYNLAIGSLGVLTLFYFLYK